MKKFLLKLLFLGCLFSVVSVNTALATVTYPATSPFVYGTTITPLTPGGTTTTGAFSMTAGAAAFTATGLNFSTTTGVISGTPTAVATTFTITVKRGTSTVNVNITVLPTAPTAPSNTTICGSGTVTLTASNSTPTGGTYNWYTAATGGTLLTPTPSATYTPYVLTTTTYYVDYTKTSTSTRTPVTVTVNPTLDQVTDQPNESYPFTGGSANDFSGNGNNGALVNTPTAAADRFGVTNNAYAFNGTNQSMTTTATITRPTAFSISIWFKTTSTTGGALISFGSTQTGTTVNTFDRQIYMTTTGQLYYGIGANLTINTTATYNDGLWHHAVATTSNTAAGSSLYVDDVLQDNDGTMRTTKTANGWWRVGYANLSGWTGAGANFFNGTIDDIDIFDSQLTATQAKALNGATGGSACVGGTLSLTAATVAGATYSWTGPNGFTSSSQNPGIANVTAAAAGTYVVTATVGTCSSQAIAIGTVNSLPVPVITAPASVAVNANPSPAISGSGGTNYTWNFGANATPATGTGATPTAPKWTTPGVKTITLTVTNAAGCTQTTTQTINVTLPGTLANYTLTMPLTVNSTGLALNNLTDFPFLLTITDPSLKTTVTGCNGSVVKFPGPTSYDFAFYDPTSGAEAPYQVVKYDPVAGTLLAWVKIHTLQASPNPNNTLYFLYGAAAANTANDPTAVWDNSFQAVYNFDEKTYTGTVADATNGHPGTATGMSAADLVAGKVGNVYTFNASKFIKAASGLNIGGDYTISAWVKMATVNTDQKIVSSIRKYNSGFPFFITEYDGYKLSLANSNSPPTTGPVYVEQETRIGIFENDTKGATGGTNLAAAASTTWYHIAGVYNSNNFIGTGSFTCYVNSVSQRAVGGGDPGNSPTSIVIGQDYDGTNPFNGNIDEVKISNTARSASWIRAEYLNQDNPFIYVTKGTITANAAAATSPGVVTYTWTGAANGDQASALNWSSSPTLASNLPTFTGMYANLDIANAGTPPVLTADISLYGLTIEPGASLNLNGHTITVGCNIINSTTTGGNILYGGFSTSGITWNGSAAQTYTGVSTATASTGNMTINNAAGVTINGGPLNIYNVLKLTAGNLTVGSTGKLTLKSTSATNTASVDKIPTGSAVVGTVNVERFMTGGNASYNKRGYRLLSSPVYNNTMGPTKGYNLTALQKTTPITGWGITGTFATIPPATFDPTPTGNPSVFFYYEPDKDPTNRIIANSDYKAIKSPTDLIPVGNGILFFFRGDRTLNASKFTTTYVPEDTYLNNTGTLNQGDVNVYIPASPLVTYSGSIKQYSGAAAVSPSGGLSTSFIKSTTLTPNTDGFHLVGNPYASPIDLDIALNSTNFTNPFSSAFNYVYELDNSGAFIAYQVGTATPLGSAYGTGSSTFSRFAAPGQGFFIHVANGATLTFKEASKASSASIISNSFATAAHVAAPPQAIRVNLMLDSANADETVIQFGYNHARNKFYPDEDAPFVTGPQQTTYLTSYSSDNVPCLINQMSSLDSVKSITLYAGGPSSGRYTLTFSGAQSLDPRYRIFLKDSFMNDSLDVSNNTTYQFDLDLKNAKTYGDTRFSLVVEPTHIQDTYQLTTFTATKNNNSVQLNWKTDHEGTYTNFKLQRSIDGGKTFTTIGDIQSDGSGNYGFTDTNPMLTGSNKYRVFQTVDSTVTKTSSVITVTYSTPTVVTATNILKVYPNPVSTILNVAIKTVADGGPLLMRIYNMKSQLVLSHTFSKDSTLSMDVSKLITGNYVIHVTDSKMDYGSVTFTKL